MVARLSNLVPFALCLFSLTILSSCKHATEPTTLPSEPDTTSHDFTWHIDTLGDGSSSQLLDVAIINDTSIWATGEIYLKDSLGQFENEPYGLATWNGSDWSLKKLYYRENGASGRLAFSNIRGLARLSSSEIWFTAGSIFRWDGTSDEVQLIFSRLNFGANEKSIEKIWAASPSLMYAVGNGGVVMCYGGASWQLLTGVTSLDLKDVWGSFDPTTLQTQVLAVAGNHYVGLDRKILSLTGNTVTALSDSGIGQPLSGVWFTPNQHYYTVGSGIFDKKNLLEPSWKGGSRKITNNYTNKVRGNHVKDVFVCGAYGEILHYNGVDWRSYQSQTQIRNGQYYAIAVKGDLVVAVGEEYPRAIVAIGRR